MTGANMGTPERIVLRGGTVVNAEQSRGAPWSRADVAVENGVITAVGSIKPGGDDRVIDCGDRLVLPGLVDAHSHADGLLGDEGVQRGLLRQGVTTVIVGQDGVSYAPGDGEYAAEYFAAIDGPRPPYAGSGVADYLAWADRVSRLNTAYLVPAGTVRWQVCGRSQEPADEAAREAMAALVRQGLRDGAVGLSTGLDYVPNRFQSADEIAAMSVPVAQAGGVYVSHMRGGYEANSALGIDEAATIATLVRQRCGTPLRVQISHFHADADIVLEQMDALEAAGVDATFDAYPYIRGCTLLGMPLLPPALSVQPVDEIVRVLSSEDERERLRRDWFPNDVAHNASLGPQWPSMITFAHIDAPRYAWALGLTIEQAADRAGVDPIDFALDVMRDCRLRVNVVMAVQNPRPVSELARIFAHPRHMGGSDGIFIGAHPHPRARGTFARYLREYVRETETWSWPQAVGHLSWAPITRFGLGDRGVIAPGAVADLIVVDPQTVADTATYERPVSDAVGIDDVLVGGVAVVAGGELVGGRPGRALRHTSAGGRNGAFPGPDSPAIG